MRLVQLRIQNFRNFNDTVFPFTKSQLILGANNSGKTTITLAINYAINQEHISKNDLINEKEKAKFTLNFFDENNDIHTMIYESKGTKTSTKCEWISEPNEIPSNIFIPSELIDATKIAQDIAMQNNVELTELRNQLESGVKNSVEELLNSVEPRDLIIGESPQFVATTNIKIETKLTGTTNKIPFQQNGAGYKKALSVALLKKLKNNATLIMIDEIENHVSIPNVRDIISRLVETNNIIFTSHRLEAKINDIKGITFLGENEVDIVGAIESLSIEIEQYDKVILVEGKNDIYYVNKFLELREGLQRAIVVYVKGENQMNEVLEKLSSRISSSKIVALKDGDKSEKHEEKIIYLAENDIESYHDDKEKIKAKFPKLYKSICSQKLDFLTPEHRLFIELNRKIFDT